MNIRNKQLTGEEITKNFGIQLARIRKTMGFSQAELAKAIGMSEATIGHWEQGRNTPDAVHLYRLCTELNCSPSQLLDLSEENLQDKVGYGLKWRIRESDAALGSSLEDQIIPEFRKQIETGLKIFELAIGDNPGFDKIRTDSSFAGYSEDALRHYLKVVFFSNAAQLIDVDRDYEREARLRRAFSPHLHQCFVAQADPALDNVIRTEAVAFLATKFLIPLLPHTGSVGLTGGTTIARFVDLVPPVLPRLSGITWIPLLASSQPNKQIVMSANSVVARMLYKQPQTKGSILPFIDLPRRDLKYVPQTSHEQEGIRTGREILEAAQWVSVAIISISSTEFNFQMGETFFGLPDLKDVYDKMSEEDRPHCVGDILLQLVDEKGQRAGSVSEQEANDELVYTIGLSGLKNIAKRGTVWILAARSQKARTIKGALLSGIANGLVVDSTVADALLDLAP